MERRVVITGMGALTPLGKNLETTWEGIVNGRSGIDSLTLFDSSTFPVRIAGEVKDFSPDPTKIPGDMQTLAGRSIQLCIETTRMAIKDSGIDLNREDLNRIGISLGADEEYLQFSMIEGIYASDHTHRAFVEGRDAYCDLNWTFSPLCILPSSCRISLAVLHAYLVRFFLLTHNHTSSILSLPKSESRLPD